MLGQNARVWKTGIGFLCVWMWATATAVGDDKVRGSIVKIFAAQSPPNMFRPWEVRPAQEATGSGVVIEGGRILTNAHVVKDAQQIYVQPNQSSERLDAKVEFFGENCDLATLTLDDAEAMAKLPALPLETVVPALQTKVEVLGYPTGGDTLSVTEGVVSRIEYAPYYGDTALLRIQVDAAINPGNSGGAAVVDGKLVGIVFSRLSQADNIGYIIPIEVIQHFLEDWKSDNDFDGFPVLDINVATLENNAIRSYLKLAKDQTGVVIHRVNDPKLRGVLQPWDVVMACDGVSIDNLGMIARPDGLRVAWPSIISQHKAGETVKFSVLREGSPVEVDIPTSTRPEHLIQPMKGDRPTYFVYGGLVFTPVTTELLLQGGPQLLTFLAVGGRLTVKRVNEYRPEPDFELVATCSRMLPHKVNKGYGIEPLSVITHVNETPVRNMRHLVELIQKNQDQPFITLRFEDEYEEKIVFDPKEVADAQPQILQQNNIPAASSHDLRDLLEPAAGQAPATPPASQPAASQPAASPMAPPATPPAPPPASQPTSQPT